MERQSPLGSLSDSIDLRAVQSNQYDFWIFEISKFAFPMGSRNHTSMRMEPRSLVDGSDLAGSLAVIWLGAWQ